MSKETSTCDECGVEMNNTNEICEDCISWSCSLIDEELAKENAAAEAMYDREASKI